MLAIKGNKFFRLKKIVLSNLQTALNNNRWLMFKKSLTVLQYAQCQCCIMHVDVHIVSMFLK